MIKIFTGSIEIVTLAYNNFIKEPLIINPQIKGFTENVLLNQQTKVTILVEYENSNNIQQYNVLFEELPFKNLTLVEKEDIINYIRVKLRKSDNILNSA